MDEGGTNGPARVENQQPEGPWRRAWIDTWVRYAEPTLLVMAVLMIPLIVVPAAVDLSRGWARAFLVADIVIWVAFAADFSVRLGGARNRRDFVRHNWVDIIIIAVPFLRPLRIFRSVRALRLLRLTRLGAFIGYAGQTSKERLKKHNLHSTTGTRTRRAVPARSSRWA